MQPWVAFELRPLVCVPVRRLFIPATNAIGSRAPGAVKRPNKTIDDGGFKLVSGKKRCNNGSKAVIGTRKGSNQLKENERRFLAAFISRLDPMVTVDDMSLYVKSLQVRGQMCEIKN